MLWPYLSLFSAFPKAYSTDPSFVFRPVRVRKNPTNSFPEFDPV